MAAVYIESTPFQAGVFLGGTATPYLYVADSGNHRIQCFDYDGRWLFSFGSYGTGDGEFDTPYGVCSDDEYVWVVDSFNNRIQKFTLKGVFVWSVGTTGNSDLEFDLPKGIAVDSDFLYVVDQNNHRIQIIDKYDGNFDYTFGSFGSGTNQFSYPTDIAVDDSFIYIDDTGNGRIVIVPKLTRYNYIIADDLMDTAAFGVDNYSDCDMAANSPMDTAAISGSIGLMAGIAVDDPMDEFLAGDSGFIVVDDLMDTASFAGVLTRVATLSVNDVMDEVSLDGTATVRARMSVIDPMDAPDLDGVTIISGAFAVQSLDEYPLWHGVITSIGSISAISPMDAVSITSNVLIYAQMAATEQIDAVGIYSTVDSEGTTTTYLTLTINPENFALSTFSNYEFNSFAMYKGRALGCNATGLQELIGDTDNGTEILMDVTYPGVYIDQSVVHKLLEANVQGRWNTPIVLRVYPNSDDEEYYDYPSNVVVEGKGSETERHELITFGKGLRGTHFRFEVLNTAGGSTNIQNIRLMGIPRPHKRR